MGKYINVGADVHDRTVVLKLAEGLSAPERRRFSNDADGRTKMIDELLRRSGDASGAEVVLAYEASGLGFGLYDELSAAGITCHVLAPTRIARSSKQKRDKTDDRDAEQLFELVRGHTMAGNKLPICWIPNVRIRDDREIVRARVDAGEKSVRVRTQIRTLLKRNQVSIPPDTSARWGGPLRRWLWDLALGKEMPETELGAGARIALESLLQQLEALDREISQLDEEVEVLAGTKPYADSVKALTKMVGVGTLTAMVFLTEMGDLTRFKNRRQIASYLGLVPSKAESGETDDRKGHITKQGPPRVRKVLCQAIWTRHTKLEPTRVAVQRISHGKPGRRKVAVVALMRRLAIVMWHRALEAAGVMQADMPPEQTSASAGPPGAPDAGQTETRVRRGCVTQPAERVHNETGIRNVRVAS